MSVYVVLVMYIVAGVQVTPESALLSRLYCTAPFPAIAFHVTCISVSDCATPEIRLDANGYVVAAFDVPSTLPNAFSVFILKSYTVFCVSAVAEYVVEVCVESVVQVAPESVLCCTVYPTSENPLRLGCVQLRFICVVLCGVNVIVVTGSGRPNVLC